MFINYDDKKQKAKIKRAEDNARRNIINSMKQLPDHLKTSKKTKYHNFLTSVGSRKVRKQRSVKLWTIIEE